ALRRARDAGRREIIGDPAFLFRRCGIDQPHQEEERHHRGDEVGVGHFPGAAMVAAANDLLHFFDRNGLVSVGAHGRSGFPGLTRFSRQDTVKVGCMADRSETPALEGSGFDSLAYRRALGGFGTGVALVAAHDDQGRAHGLIINSLTSGSLDPPIMLWCLSNSSAAFDVFTNCPSFSLNILRAGDEAVAKQSSPSGARIIPPSQISTIETGAPVPSAAAARLDRRMRLRQPMGAHAVIYGDVVPHPGDHGVD